MSIVPKSAQQFAANRLPERTVTESVEQSNANHKRPLVRRLRSATMTTSPAIRLSKYVIIPLVSIIFTIRTPPRAAMNSARLDKRQDTLCILSLTAAVCNLSSAHHMLSFQQHVVSLRRRRASTGVPLITAQFPALARILLFDDTDHCDRVVRRPLAQSKRHA